MFLPSAHLANPARAFRSRGGFDFEIAFEIDGDRDGDVDRDREGDRMEIKIVWRWR